MTLSTPYFLATDARAYEHFMARWSRRLAGPFLDFAGIKGGNRVLDVGCGTGVITAALAERGCTVVGLDASEPYLEGARHDRSHPNIVYELGDARRMSYADASFDACVSALAIDIVPEVDQVVREMRRVTRGGGTVASGVFDFWGGLSPADLVCDTASVLDEGMRSVRDQRKARPIVWANGQAAIWRESGLVDVVEAPIVISFDYASFEDYWSSYSTPPRSHWPACSGIARGAARRGRAARPQRVSGWPARRAAVVRRHRPCGAGHCTGRRGRPSEWKRPGYDRTADLDPRA